MAASAPTHLRTALERACRKGSCISHTCRASSTPRLFNAVPLQRRASSTTRLFNAAPLQRRASSTPRLFSAASHQLRGRPGATCIVRGRRRGGRRRGAPRRCAARRSCPTPAPPPPAPPACAPASPTSVFTHSSRYARRSWRRDANEPG
jgi:hypothetical protein